MNRIPTIVFCTLMLAGCADSYDRAALPGAAAALNQQTVRCKARWTAKELKNYSEWQACQLAVERSFATSVRLKMEAFDKYDADMRVLAADRDAGRVTEREVRSRAEDIRWTFLADCGCKPAWKPNMAYGQFFLTSLLLDPRPPSMPTTP